MTDVLHEIGKAYDDGVEGVHFEGGQLEMTMKKAPAAPVEPKTPPAGEGDGFEERYKEVQGWATRTAQENANLKNEMAELRGSLNVLLKQRGGEEGSEEPAVELDLGDPQQVLAYIEKQVEKGVAKRLEPYSDTISQVQEEANFRNFVFGEGGIGLDAWNQWGPAMIQESQRLTEAGLEVPDYPQLLKMTQETYEPVPDEGAGDADEGYTEEAIAGNEPATPQEPTHAANEESESLDEQASRLSMTAGVQPAGHGYGLPTSDSPIETPRDAMGAALAELEAAGSE